MKVFWNISSKRASQTFAYIFRDNQGRFQKFQYDISYFRQTICKNVSFEIFKSTFRDTLKKYLHMLLGCKIIPKPGQTFSGFLWIFMD